MITFAAERCYFLFRCVEGGQPDAVGLLFFAVVQIITIFAVRDSAAAAYLAHNQVVVGSSPAPATKLFSRDVAVLAEMLVPLIFFCSSCSIVVQKWQKSCPKIADN